MPKQPSLTPRKLVRLLHKHGFVEDHQTGSHLILIHPRDGRRVVEPVHTKDLPRGTMLAILKSARIPLQ